MISHEATPVAAEDTAGIGLFSSTALVVTNMVGTGVFTSLGFQLAAIGSPTVILLLWRLGGPMALCGAPVYGEPGGESVLTGVGIPPSRCTCLSVAGILVVRARRLPSRSPDRCWGDPVPPVVFLGLNPWMLAFVLWQRPLASGRGLSMVPTKIPVFFWRQRRGDVHRVSGRFE